MNALTKGDSSHLAEDVPEALAKYGQPIKVIEGPLMSAMEHIGVLFGEGKMFLPQVVRSAQVMKDAVALLPIQDSSPFKGESEGVCGLPYYQVFASRHGFLPDLSIVDLLFNQGPEGVLWL